MWSSTFHHGRRRPGRDRWSRKPGLLVLEDRTLPSTLTVLNNADHGDGSLRAAIADAHSGDQIIFDPSLRGQTIALTSGELTIDKSLDLEGLGADQLAVSGNHQSRVFDISGAVTVTIAGLTVTDGLVFTANTTALGGGILNNGGDVTLDHVVLQNNVAQGGNGSLSGSPGSDADGGAIYSSGGALTLTGASITNNQALGGNGASGAPGGGGGSANGGGLYVTGGSLDISGSRLANNRATGGQGGAGTTLHCTHVFSYTSCISLGSIGGAGVGGGLYVTGGSLSVASSTIASNQAIGGPRGGPNGYPGAEYGGGLVIVSPTGTVSNSTLSGNSAYGSRPDGDGGGIYNGGTLTVSNSTLAGNSAQDGGGISNGGTLTVSNSTLSGNSADGTYPDGYGGGIDNGVGIYNGYESTLTVTGSTLSGNSASFYAGGIANEGTLTVSNSTLSGNSAYTEAGGISNDDSGTLTVNNSTLSGNSAFYSGGGIFNSGTLTVSNSTLSGNSAYGGYSDGYGGGIYGNGTLDNTIVAGSTASADPDLDGTYNSQGYNLIGDGTGGSGFTSTDRVGTAGDPIDPRLGPLQDNGGPAFTMALLPGSPALDAGDPAQLGTADQRGVRRTGGVNIGAYQASATAFVLTAPDKVTSGVPFDVTVTAVDPFGQVAVGYTGTITFRTTDPDPGVVLPADYPFQPTDAGQVTFPGGVTLITPGDQVLTVVDTADDTLMGSALVTVDSTAPGAGAPGPGQPPQPGRWPDVAAPPSAPSPGQGMAVDGWFAALNASDVGFVWVPPIRHVRTEVDGWALDPWWAGEPLVLVERG